MPFFLEVKKKSPNHAHHHQQDGGARDKRKSFQMHSIGRNSIGHPTISVSSVTPPTDGSEYRISARAGLGPDEILVSSKKSSLTPGMATAGLVIAARNDFQVWTTRIALSGSEEEHEFDVKPSKSRRSGTRYSDFSSNVSSPLVSILGEEKYRRVSQLIIHARQVSPSERCFFVLLILVTFIYAVGILTALILLCFHMWFF